jgi:predicted permease
VARRQELAVRAALGASRGRVVRLLLTESLVVATVGAAAGALLAWWGTPLLLSLAGDALPRAHGVTLNARVLAAVAAMAIATGLVAGIAPVLFALRAHASTLKDGTAGAGTSGWRVRFGDGLVVAQVAMTMVLLAGSALLASSFARLMRVDAGFDATGVVVAQLQLTGTRHTSAEQQGAFGAAVLERVRALPGVEAAAVSTAVPLDGGNIGSITVEGRPAREDAPWAWLSGVTPGYFELLGLPLLRGRALAESDAAGGDAVVVNRALVREFFGDADPIGRTVTYYGNVTGRVVGVVGDTRQQGLDEAAPPQIYIPFPRETSPYMKISVRAREGVAVAAAVREAVRSVDPMLPLDRVASLSAMVSDSVARERFYAVLLALFAGTALAIAAMGLYGLTAYTLTRRHRELGIRLALGAGGRRLVWSLVGRVGVLGAVGIGLGLAGALASARVLRAHLFELSPTDPPTLALAAATLAGTALLASWLPARRAARVDPVVALRSE